MVRRQNNYFDTKLMYLIDNTNMLYIQDVYYYLLYTNITFKHILCIHILYNIMCIYILHVHGNNCGYNIK